MGARHTRTNRSTGEHLTTNASRKRHQRQRAPYLRTDVELQYSAVKRKSCGTLYCCAHPAGTVLSAASSPSRSSQEASFPCMTAPASRRSPQRGLGSGFSRPGETGEQANMIQECCVQCISSFLHDCIGPGSSMVDRDPDVR